MLHGNNNNNNNPFIMCNALRVLKILWYKDIRFDPNSYPLRYAYVYARRTYEFPQVFLRA